MAKRKQLSGQEKVAPEIAKVQKACGVWSLVGVFILLTAFFFIPSELVNRKAEMIALVCLAFAIIVYYSIPAFYLNKRYLVSIDILIIITLTLTIYFARSFGLLFFFFFYWLITVDSFLYGIKLYSKKQYLFIVFLCVGSAIFVSLLFPTTLRLKLIICFVQAAGLTIASIFLLFAKTLINEMKAKDELAVSLEDKVKQRTEELQGRVNELEKFHKITVGRELKMAELKKTVNKMEAQLRDLEAKTKK